MKNTIRIATVLAALMVGMASSSVIAQDDAGKGGDGGGGGGSLPGAWDANVTIYNCSTGATIRQFASLGVFSKGGTFTGITAGTPPAARSNELGVWQHVDGGNYVFRFKAFLFDATGNPIGYQVVTHQIRLYSDNNYISDGGAQIFNMAGVQIGTGCSWAAGTRMTVPY